MNYIYCIYCFILAILFCGVVLYARRQLVKRRNREDVEIPVFLVGGEYPAENSISGVKTEWNEVSIIVTRCK